MQIFDNIIFCNYNMRVSCTPTRKATMSATVQNKDRFSAAMMVPGFQVEANQRGQYEIASDQHPYWERPVLKQRRFEGMAMPNSSKTITIFSAVLEEDFHGEKGSVQHVVFGIVSVKGQPAMYTELVYFPLYTHEGLFEEFQNADISEKLALIGY